MKIKSLSVALGAGIAALFLSGSVLADSHNTTNNNGKQACQCQAESCQCKSNKKEDKTDCKKCKAKMDHSHNQNLMDHKNAE